MASVIGVVIALLVLFVITVLVLLYAYKKQKICFRGEKNVFLRGHVAKTTWENTW